MEGSSAGIFARDASLDSLRGFLFPLSISQLVGLIIFPKISSTLQKHKQHKNKETEVTYASQVSAKHSENLLSPRVKKQ